MGTWDVGFFDNDMACDWENDINESTGLSYIEQALLPVIEESEESLDIDLANRALAAAEALARFTCRDGDHNSFTEHLDAWAERFSGEIPESIKTMALSAIQRIISIDSELKQFWTIRGELENWTANINRLKDRLSN